MANVNAKCTNCGEIILINDIKDADICPHCNTAFVTEKAIKLYSQPPEQIEQDKQVKKAVRRHVFKSFLLGLWFTFKCFLYLIYVVCLLWLIFDIYDDVTKK